MKAGFSIVSVRELERERFPAGALRLDYSSRVDGTADWAIALPPKSNDTWVVTIHGHGAQGDQLYTRPDIRDTWLPTFLRTGAGILTPNLRGNAWMSPAASEDLHDLLSHMRGEYGAKRFVLASGSVGGTSNLIYACLHPEDVAGVIAMCPATDLASYHAWCRKHADVEIIAEIAGAIERAYGGSPEKRARAYARHSALRNAAKLRMPVYVAHGTIDGVIPVSQSRRLVAEMGDLQTFVYVEVPDGGHDAPLKLVADGLGWVMRTIKGTDA